MRRWRRFEPVLAGRFWVKKRVFAVKSVVHLTKSDAHLIKSVSDLTPTATDLIKSLNDLTQSVALLIKSVFDLIKSVTDLTPSVTDLTKSVTDLIKSAVDLIKSVTDLIKSINDLTHWTSDFRRKPDGRRMKTGHFWKCGMPNAECGMERLDTRTHTNEKLRQCLNSSAKVQDLPATEPQVRNDWPWGAIGRPDFTFTGPQSPA